MCAMYAMSYVIPWAIIADQEPWMARESNPSCYLPYQRTLNASPTYLKYESDT